MSIQSLKFFENFSETCLAELDELKERGVQIAGIYCVFAPTELVRAAGAVPVGLCGKKQAPISKAEETLPANLCPLIKSSYGYAVTDTCPFFAFSDFILGETTCDGKKKMFELLGKIKPLFLMHLPYAPESPEALRFWHGEILRLKGFLEEQTGNEITAGELRRQIRLGNETRRLFWRLMEFYRRGGAPMSGMELLPVLESKSFFGDMDTYHRALERLIAELEDVEKRQDRAPDGRRPRILITGTPQGKGSEKVLRLVEANGGRVVCQENCTGIKPIHGDIDENDPDPFRALARRYLAIPCSCMTPNQGRFDLLDHSIRDYGVHGVVDLTWQYCHTYNVEAFAVRRFVEENHGIPVLHLESDYSESDLGQLNVRIEAFLEMLRGKTDLN